MAGQAEPALLISGSWQRLLLARWLRGEAERALGNLAPARQTYSKKQLRTPKFTDSRRSRSVVLARLVRSPWLKEI